MVAAMLCYAMLLCLDESRHSNKVLKILKIGSITDN